jgi:large subunit ribosomal protein L14
MIQTQTILKIVDNSGAKTAKCIKILQGFQKKTSKLGDIVIVSVQKLRNKSKKTSKVKKGEIYKALIIRTKLSTKTKNAITLKFRENAAVLLNKQGNPVGTRIIGSIPKLLQKKAFQKFTAIATGIV